jgi:hypothetical protein
MAVVEEMRGDKSPRACEATAANQTGMDFVDEINTALRSYTADSILGGR